MSDLIHIHPEDTVAVALQTVPAGTVFGGVTARMEIPQGHKMAVSFMNRGEQIVKYGVPIGHATTCILPGCWVHTHNMATNLTGEETYT